MGHINPRVLYSDLLHDLSGHLPNDVLDLLRSGASVSPWPDITLSEMYALQLANSFLKKFKDGASKEAELSSLTKFLHVNQRVGSWSYDPVDSWDEVLFGELKSVVYDYFYPKSQPLITSFESILDSIRVGPGASIDGVGQDLYSKLFASSLTHTDEVLYRVYRNFTKNKPRWSSAESIRTEHFGFARKVEGNRLRFVPKNRDIARTICIEPTLNMSFQLGVGGILEDRLKTFFGIDIRSQPDINRELCRKGSIDQSFVTIDLESASDSMSMAMLKSIIPANQLVWLTCCRSPSSELPDGSRVMLNMISTMGNGYTFPLQTMLFASIITAAARARGFHLGRPRADSDATYGVFGDDMVIPTGCHYDERRKVFVNYSDTLVRDCQRLLRLLGFVVNSSKSFFEGPFRESCGYDSFKGHNVRGVYVKTLQTMQSRYVAINTLNRWCSGSGINLPKTLHRLHNSVRLIPVPNWEADDSGIKVPFSLIRKYKRCKYNQSILYRRFVPHTPKLRIGEGEFLGNARQIYNPCGLLLAFINGNIRNGSISIRSGTVCYRYRPTTTPFWDYSGPVAGSNPAGRRWETVVSFHLGGRKFEV